jgi:3,4-dihydroxy 2-butanone 4-phosphate synthase / GTP cyclohydrolase II
LPQLKEFARKHDLKIGTIESLIQYRIENESFVEEKVRAELPSLFGAGFEVRAFVNHLDGREHLALVKGDIQGDSPVLVRVHTECVMGDVFGSLRTRSGEYLQQSMRKIDAAGKGVIVYLRTEDMGDRLLKRIQSYSDLDAGRIGADEVRVSFKSDSRDYGVGAQILRELGVRKINLLTNSQAKRVGLKGYGLEIVDTTHLNVEPGTLHDETHPWNKDDKSL